MSLRMTNSSKIGELDSSSNAASKELKLKAQPRRTAPSGYTSTRLRSSLITRTNIRAPVQQPDEGLPSFARGTAGRSAVRVPSSSNNSNISTGRKEEGILSTHSSRSPSISDSDFVSPPAANTEPVTPDAMLRAVTSSYPHAPANVSPGVHNLGLWLPGRATEKSSVDNSPRQEALYAFDLEQTVVDVTPSESMMGGKLPMAAMALLTNCSFNSVTDEVEYVVMDDDKTTLLLCETSAGSEGETTIDDQQKLTLPSKAVERGSRERLHIMQAPASADDVTTPNITQKASPESPLSHQVTQTTTTSSSLIPQAVAEQLSSASSPNQPTALMRLLSDHIWDKLANIKSSEFAEIAGNRALDLQEMDAISLALFGSSVEAAAGSFTSSSSLSPCHPPSSPVRKFHTKEASLRLTVTSVEKPHRRLSSAAGPVEPMAEEPGLSLPLNDATAMLKNERSPVFARSCPHNKSRGCETLEEKTEQHISKKLAMSNQFDSFPLKVSMDDNNPAGAEAVHIEEVAVTAASPSAAVPVAQCSPETESPSGVESSRMKQASSSKEKAANPQQLLSPCLKHRVTEDPKLSMELRISKIVDLLAQQQNNHPSRLTNTLPTTNSQCGIESASPLSPSTGESMVEGLEKAMAVSGTFIDSPGSLAAKSPMQRRAADNSKRSTESPKQAAHLRNVDALPSINVTITSDIFSPSSKTLQSPAAAAVSSQGETARNNDNIYHREASFVSGVDSPVPSTLNGLLSHVRENLSPSSLSLKLRSKRSPKASSRSKASEPSKANYSHQRDNMLSPMSQISGAYSPSEKLSVKMSPMSQSPKKSSARPPRDNSLQLWHGPLAGRRNGHARHSAKRSSPTSASSSGRGKFSPSFLDTFKAASFQDIASRSYGVVSFQPVSTLDEGCHTSPARIAAAFRDKQEVQEHKLLPFTATFGTGWDPTQSSGWRTMSSNTRAAALSTPPPIFTIEEDKEMSPPHQLLPVSPVASPGGRSTLGLSQRGAQSEETEKKRSVCRATSLQPGEPSVLAAKQQDPSPSRRHSKEASNSNYVCQQSSFALPREVQGTSPAIQQQISDLVQQIQPQQQLINNTSPLQMATSFDVTTVPASTTPPASPPQWCSLQAKTSPAPSIPRACSSVIQATGPAQSLNCEKPLQNGPSTSVLPAETRNWDCKVLLNGQQQIPPSAASTLYKESPIKDLPKSVPQQGSGSRSRLHRSSATGVAKGESASGQNIPHRRSRSGRSREVLPRHDGKRKPTRKNSASLDASNVVTFVHVVYHRRANDEEASHHLSGRFQEGGEKISVRDRSVKSRSSNKVEEECQEASHGSLLFCPCC